MIEYVISSLCFIIGTFIGNAICSNLFENSNSLKQTIFEMLIFLLLSNYLLFNTYTPANDFVICLIYLLFSMVSIIVSRVVGFLIFNRILKKFFFKDDKFKKKNLLLAKQMLNKLTKDEVINHFKRSGFDKEFINHLKAVLKE